MKQFKLSGYAQGTTYSIIYYAKDSLLSSSEVDSVFKSLDSSLSLYKPFSLINAFNKASRELQVDMHLQKVVERALQVHAATAGAFDITVWPLVNAWGFGLQKIDAPPAQGEIERLMTCVGSNKLNLKGNALQKQLPCVMIDVNGIAQGYSVDVLAQLLELKGISNYLVEIGGEIRMKGRKQPGNERMKIGIESPAETPFQLSLIRGVLMPDSGAITTSGSYLKFYESNGRRLSHLIDPRTGQSIQNDLISVTVFAKDAITADAYDNALMVMGLDEALRFAASNSEIEAYFIYHRKDGKVGDTCTAGFRRLFGE